MTSEDELASGADAEAVSGNLPVALTRLIGREGALAELSGLLWGTRLLTLCGPGGAGKTRLALAIAEAARADFMDGAWWVDLSAATDRALVAQVVAAAVLPAEPAPDSAVVALARRFAEPALLVLDNCEQVLAGARGLVIELLSRAPSFKVVATSRQSLAVPGEQVFRVEGLGLDAVAGPGTVGYSGTLAADSDSSAVELFIERAREISASFDPTPDMRAEIAGICRSLDGIPLAIELAAARVSVLGVAEIAVRLEHDASFLRDPTGRGPERHRTLQGTLEWSYRMLRDAEQRLFRRLGAFRGSFSLAAVEAVCAVDSPQSDDVLDLLSALVDRSLVQVVDLPKQPRYRLLATIRQYAVAKLEDSGEAAALRRRQAEYFLGIAGQERLQLAGGEQFHSLERLELERDNFDQALTWLETHTPEDAGRMAGLLWQFWYRRGYYREARRRFEQVLRSADQLSPEVRADILLRAGEAAFLQCDYALALVYLGQALDLFADLGDARATATVLQRLGSIAREQGRYAVARGHHKRSLGLWRSLGDAAGIAEAHDYLGFVAWLAGDLEDSEALCSQALSEFRRGQRAHHSATALVNLGCAALYRGEAQLAEERLDEALRMSRRLGFQEGIAWSSHELAILARNRRGPTSERAVMLRDALLIHQQLGDRWRVASVLEEIAGSLVTHEDPRLAAALLGYSEALRASLGTPIPSAEAPDLDAARSRLERRLGAAAIQSHRAEGKAWTLDRAVDVACQVIEPLASASGEVGRAPKTPILTARELAVLRLVAEGQTNREIAEELYISPSTAGVHVSNILRKIGAKRRVDAASMAHTLELLAAA